MAAKRLAADVLTKSGIDGVERDPVADVLVQAVSGQVITLRLLWWSKPERGEFLLVQDRVLTAIRDAFATAGIALA